MSAALLGYEANNITSLPSIDTPSNFEEYSRISMKFASYHKDPTNVMLHLVTTPLGFIGVVGALMKLTNSTTPAGVSFLFYLITLLSCVPSGSFIGTAVLCLAVLLFARYLKPSLVFPSS